MGLICLLVAASYSANAHTSPAETRDNHTDELIQKIQAGDPAAIAEAGQSGNHVFVPYIRQAIKLDSKTRDTAGPGRVALAKLGEPYQLQEEWCRAVSGNPHISYVAAIEELGNIGGWFAIQGLQIFLTPEGENLVRNFTRKPRHITDAMDPSPMQVALQTLPKTVPNPPIGSPSSASGSLDPTKIWRDWIAANKDKLNKLQPIGGGVDFSDAACRNGKPRKKRQD